MILDVAEFQPCEPKCWQDALKIALATHPLEEIRAWGEGVTCQEAEVILDRLPVGLLTLVRVCMDILVNQKDDPRLEAAAAIACEKLLGCNVNVDKMLIARAKRPVGVSWTRDKSNEDRPVPEGILFVGIQPVKSRKSQYQT